VASITPGDPWYAPTLQAVTALGPVHLVTTEEGLVECLSAYAGRGAYLRQEALRTVRAILDNAHVTIRPQTHESFMKGLDFYASRADKAYSKVGVAVERMDSAHVLFTRYCCAVLPLIPPDADGWDRPNGPFLAVQRG
jgi:hypothetical protein